MYGLLFVYYSNALHGRPTIPPSINMPTLKATMQEVEIDRDQEEEESEYQHKVQESMSSIEFRSWLLRSSSTEEEFQEVRGANTVRRFDSGDDPNKLPATPTPTTIRRAEVAERFAS